MVVLLEKIIITGKIATVTGLKIGSTPTEIVIGGLDNHVIKDHKGRPYIPGSSVKGKMRSLLERSMGLFVEGKVIQQDARIRIHMCNDPNCPICNIFGRTNGEKELAVFHNPPINLPKVMISNASPTRLKVRDALLIEESIPEDVRDRQELGWTEVKYENVIDRITSAATPRQMERVPPEAEFKFNMVYDIYDPNDRENLKVLFEGMQLLQDDYLGGSGSRGYGRVEFKDLTLYRNTSEDYKNGNTDTSEKAPMFESDSPASVQRQLMGYQW